MRNFSDPSVGAVGAELVYRNRNSTGVGDGQGVYWKYEKFLKSMESRITSLIGVSGCCYAVRRELYEAIPPGLISDFLIAQIIYKKGKRVVYEPEALSCEDANENMDDEFKMRIRVGIRTLYGLFYMRSLLNPLKYGLFSLQLISHKIFRYLVPLVMLFAFFLNAALCVNNGFFIYKFLLMSQLFFYTLVILGAGAAKKMRVLYSFYYFFITNAALLVALFKFIAGERQRTWEPRRK